jgi:predicted RNase H-like HicB family nuclease
VDSGDREVLSTLTARYTRIASGYMGQVVEWPEVVTEGRDLEECRALLQDALREMIAAYHQLGKEIPEGGALLEQISVELADVRQAG